MIGRLEAVARPSVVTLPNPSRAQIQARLAQLAPVPAVDLGRFDSGLHYDRNSVLSTLPGDDLQAIAVSASKDAATCSKSGTLRGVFALATWLAGLVCLFVPGAPVAGVVALGIGWIGIFGRAKKLARSNHDTLLMNVIQQLFSSPDAAHRS